MNTHHSISIHPRPTGFLFSLTVGCLLVGCSDPSKSVPASSAAEPTAKPAESTPTPTTKTYAIRSGSSVEFIGSKVTGSHNGGFKSVMGAFTVDGGKITGTPEVKIGMKSIWSDNDKLTGHLRSPDFFDVEKFPVATFSITGIETTGSTNKVTGNLDLHGVTKSIAFPATIEISDDSLAVKAAFAINRRQWNINYAGKANDLIRDNVVVKLDLKATPGPVRPEDQLGN